MKKIIFTISIFSIFCCAKIKKQEIIESDTAINTDFNEPDQSLANENSNNHVIITSQENNYGVDYESIKKNKEIINTNYYATFKDSIYGKGVLILDTKTSFFNKDLVIKNEDREVVFKMNYSENELDIFNEQPSRVYDPPSDFLYQVGFLPRQFFVEYQTMHFTCIGESEDYFKVILNEDNTNTIGLISKKNNFFKLLSWEEYILNSYVSLFNKDIEIKISPSLSSKNIELLSKEIVITPTEIKGSWLKVECNKKSCIPCEKEFEGWIMWKKDSKLLFEIGFSC